MSDKCSRGLLDHAPFNEPYDGLWDLVILPAGVAGLFVPGWRAVGAATLALWSSRAVALYGESSPKPGAAA